MGCPPSSGAVHEMVSVVAVFDVTVMLVGAAGVVAGMMLVSAVEYGLVPSAVICAARNRYGVERASPVTVIDLDAETPSVNVVQFVPSVEYWTV